jgi:HlyD family secretion protein
VVVVFGLAGATYGVYAGSNGASQVELGEDQRIIPVRYGDLKNQVSTNGSLKFPEKEALRFDSAGTVAEVLVKEGQQVTQGQVLAKLDSSAVATLQEAVAEARVVLRDAQDSLSAFPQEHALQLAEVEEAVATAEFDLKTAIEALDDAQEPHTNVDIKAQEQAVAQARLALQTAQKALLGLEPNHSLQLGQALQTNRDAQVALEEAREALANFDSDHALQLAQAAEAQSAAEMALNQAQESFDNYESSGGERLVDFRDQRTEIEAKLADAQARKDHLESAQRAGKGSFYSDIRLLNAAIEAYQDSLDDLSKLTAEAAQLEAQVDLARQQLAESKTKLADLQKGPDPVLGQKLKAAVQVAQANVVVTENALADLLPGVDSLDLALKQAELSAAEATLKQAEQDLAEIREGADPIEVAQKEKQVGLAQAQLAKAKVDRDALLSASGPLELEVRRAKVASAQRALGDAVRRLKDSTLRSPINGLVTLVNVEEGDEVRAASTTGGGDQVDASSIIVEVVDTTIVEIDGIVDEIDVLSIQEGTPVQVTFDALPGQTFEGVVSRIAPSAQSQQGVVTFPISIQMPAPAQTQLREGLTAVASIVLNEEKNVLLVPQQALYGTFDQPMVRVVTPSGIEERPVSLGNSDDFWVAVRDGLQEGDQIIMESAAVSTTGGGFGQFRAISGGGRGPR